MISAVVVTYNRLDLLKKCIQSLRNQIRKVDKIIVINNGSTDDTETWLKKQQDVVVITQENLGGAAGFYRGMKEAYECGADWVWIMDDDAFPDENCLSRLTGNHLFSAERNVMLSPIVIEGNRIDFSHRGYIDFKKFNYPAVQEKISPTCSIETPNPVPLTFASFIGILVGRKVIETIGFPVNNYFMFNDDVEYSIRVVKQKFPIFLIKDAVVFHRVKDEKVKIESESDLVNYIGTNGNGQKRRNFEVYVTAFIGKRNLLYMVLKYEGINLYLMKYVYQDFKNFIWSMASSKRVDKWRLIKLNYLAYRQGISGKFNNDRFFAVKK